MASSYKRFLRHHQETVVVGLAILLVTVFVTVSRGLWASPYNLASVLQVTATLGILSLGEALVITSGEIDISLGSTFGISALAYLGLVSQLGSVAALLIGLVAGLAIGALNGILVVRFRIPSLIMTLGTLLIFRGLAIAITEGFSFSIPWAQRKGLAYQVIGGGNFLGINTAAYWMLGLLIVLQVLIFATPFGNHLLAVGGDSETAHSRGIRVGRIKFTAFALCGLLAGFAGVLEAGKLGYADGSFGRLMELQAIAACVLGGCSLAGGRVTFIGTLVGTFVLMGIQSFLVVMGVQPQWFVLMLGAIVIAAASADRMFRNWVSRGV
jgi:simple sugar transport system permease protein/ribose transport system permease protein